MIEVREVLPSAARTSAPASVVLDVPRNATRVLIITDVTAITATPSITPSVNGAGPSGTEYDILDDAAITAVEVSTLEIGPEKAAAANVAAQAYLPGQIVVDVAHADADEITYSVYAVFS